MIVMCGPPRHTTTPHGSTTYELWNRTVCHTKMEQITVLLFRDSNAHCNILTNANNTDWSVKKSNINGMHIQC